MPILNRTEALQPTLVEWRQSLHRHPELGYQEHKTAAFVADKLNSMGIEVVSGLGQTGLVGKIEGRYASDRAIGLRADMDALPILEQSEVAYASQNPGVMHACGHDGHTTMLLGAAQILAETRNFAGTVYLIFQPAEEGGAGADAMIKDGLFERFAMDQIYGLHNLPGLPVGNFAMTDGPIMASADQFTLTIKGKGGHAALPHQSKDPIVIGAQLISALQSLVSRNTDPLQSGVLSICKFNAGHASNVIPDQAELAGTIRALTPEIRQDLKRRLSQVCQGQAASFDVEIDLVWGSGGYPPTINHTRETALAAQVAQDMVSAACVSTNAAPLMAAEDFSFMLEQKSGCYIFLGNGDSAGLHSPSYVFNDEAMPFGVSYFVSLAEQILAPQL